MQRLKSPWEVLCDLVAVLVAFYACMYVLVSESEKKKTHWSSLDAELEPWSPPDPTTPRASSGADFSGAALLTRRPSLFDRPAALEFLTFRGWWAFTGQQSTLFSQF